MDDGLIAFWAIFMVFGSITAIIVGPTYLKSREKRDMQQTVRHAIDKGQELPPELIDAMTKDVQRKLPSSNRDIRQGIIWLATGIGIAAFSLVSSLTGRNWGSDNVDGGLLGIACIPTVIGLAFIVLSFFNKNKD
jgi:hypothetical protein